MYYLESDSIASSQLTRVKEIEKLDTILFLNQEGKLRLVRLAAILDLDEDEVDDLIGMFENEGVVTRINVAICPDCDVVIEESGEENECDLCEKSFSRGSGLEVAFIPRRTAFEAGDVLAAARNSSDQIDGVYPVSGCANEDRSLDAVFLHGLDGNATTSWHPADSPEDYWPRWLGEDLQQVGVWSVEYEAKSLKWKGDALPLSDRATNCISKLQLAAIGSRPFVLITHSLGGLLAKQMLRHAHTMGQADWKTFSANCKAIIFLATPHSGSNISGFVQYLGALLRPTVAVEDLELHHPRLRELNQWYRNNVGELGITTKVFYETKKTKKFMVVDATSADPGIPGVVPIPVEADHIEICKPPSRGNEVYATCKQLIEQYI